MAPKKNKGPKAQNANSGSAPQGNPPKSQKSKASRSQAPQPKPKPKPAGTRTSTKKTDQSHQAKATTTTIPAPKTAVEVSKDDKISGQVQSSTKKRKHQPAMAHGSKKNNAPPGRDPRTAQLELPEGYIHPKDQSKKNNRRNRGKKAIEVSPPPPGPVLPWVLNPKFVSEQSQSTLGLASSVIVADDADFPPKPKPLGRNCNFKYDRDRWRSLAGKDVESEMEKQFTRSRRIGLRPPSLQMNEEQLKQLHGKYWQEREVELFKIRKAVMNKSGSPKLFIVVSLPVKIHTSNSHELELTLAQSSGPYYQGFNPVNVEKSPLVRFMQVPELGKMVLDRLLPSIGDLTALAATCKIAAASVRESIVCLLLSILVASGNAWLTWIFRSLGTSQRTIFPPTSFARSGIPRLAAFSNQGVSEPTRWSSAQSPTSGRPKLCTRLTSSACGPFVRTSPSYAIGLILTEY